jgi:aldehyde:ferredoxin oxidoreductase
VDLSSRQVCETPLEAEWARHYLGGAGFNARRLIDLVPMDADPLGPGNVLMIGAGPLVGTFSPAGSGRFTITSKSPQSGIFGDAAMGGFFAAEMKFAGYDQIVFTGCSEKPVYVYLEDDQVSIRDASHLWGQDTWQTQRLLFKELQDEKVQIVCIGPAGERRVRFANVMHMLKHAAGRSGMGAVMGSKNLKAVVARGRRGVKIARPKEFLEASREAYSLITSAPFYKNRSEYGTPLNMEALNEIGGVPVKNFQRSTWEEAWKVGGVRLKEEYSVKMLACFACPIHCTHYYTVKDGPYQGLYGHGPDYGLTGVFGPRCMISDLDALLKIDNLVNRYGMDSISACQMIAWAMDCFERGIFTSADFDGLEVRWGDPNVVIKLIEKIASRSGVGDVLAEGESRAPALMGRGSDRYMYHVKGLALSAEEPRSVKGFSFAYLTSTRGADHLKGSTIFDVGSQAAAAERMFGIREIADPLSLVGKGIATKFGEDFNTLVDCIGQCKSATMNIIGYEKSPLVLSKLVSSATGVDFTPQELMTVGERVYHVEKAFNTLLGLTRKEDDFSPSEKFTKEPLMDGPGKGMVFERDAMLDEYYRARGWDVKTGLVPKAKYDELGLSDIGDRLAEKGLIPED